MADGRIVSKRITRSEKVAGLSSDTVRMFYTWMIPYLDVEGRMEANPRLLKADIGPLLDHLTTKRISEILDELNKSGLIILYQADGRELLQLTKFDENQPNLRKDREAPSKLPGPTPDSLRSNSGEAPDQLPPKLREVKLREEKYKHLDSVFLTTAEYGKLIEAHGEKLVIKAIELLNQYIMSKGKQYKSHYHTLLGWPIEKAKAAGGNGQPAAQTMTPYKICPSCGKEVMEQDIEGNNCIHCAPRKPLAEILEGIGKRI